MEIPPALFQPPSPRSARRRRRRARRRNNRRGEPRGALFGAATVIPCGPRLPRGRSSSRSATCRRAGSGSSCTRSRCTPASGSSSTSRRAGGGAGRAALFRVTHWRPLGGGCFAIGAAFERECTRRRRGGGAGRAGGARVAGVRPALERDLLEAVPAEDHGAGPEVQERPPAGTRGRRRRVRGGGVRGSGFGVRGSGFGVRGSGFGVRGRGAFGSGCRIACGTFSRASCRCLRRGVRRGCRRHRGVRRETWGLKGLLKVRGGRRRGRASTGTSILRSIRSAREAARGVEGEGARPLDACSGRKA